MRRNCRAQLLRPGDSSRSLSYLLSRTVHLGCWERFVPSLGPPRLSCRVRRAVAMHISSRTPEGAPNRCPVCGNEVVLDPTVPSGDAPCPHCGQLLWFSEDSRSELRRDVTDVQIL